MFANWPEFECELTKLTIMGGDTVMGAHSVPPHSLVVWEEVKVKVMDKLAHKTPAVDFQI